jgi:tRNA pseudouridine38-40 synthase
MPNYALMLAYDGSDFAGWWRQPDRRTVATTLDLAIARLGEGSASAVGASRTDAGVHARGQVAHVQLARRWRPDHFQRALAPHLPADLSCLAAAAVSDGWHATHDAIGKTYSYWIDNGEIADPFSRHTSWRPPFRLRLERLQAVAAAVPGRRDWAAFARRGEEREDLVRTITEARWSAEGGFLVLSLAGEGFIYRLVRSLVGSMVAVAHGSLPLEAFAAALAGEPSPAGAQQAPARGLCLEQVRYAPEPAWERFDQPRAAGLPAAAAPADSQRREDAAEPGGGFGP